MLKKIGYSFLGIIIVLSTIYLFLPSPISPEAWRPDKGMAFQDALLPNELLKEAQIIAGNLPPGPEEVAADNQGNLYTGTRDGSILRVLPDGTMEIFADTKGRPLGMKFDKSQNLVVCDAYKGLLSIDTTGKIKTLAVSADDIPIKFANALDISKNGMVYFTDSSFRYGPMDYHYDLLEAKPYGRLLSYDPATRSVSVLIQKLYFANGVALSKNENFILVNETVRYRVIRYWLKGPSAGTIETFIDGLPGFPDNISSNGKGRFWLALYTVRNDFLDRIHPYPAIKKQMSKLPAMFWPGPKPYGLVLALDEDANIILSLQDPTGSVFPLVSSAREFDDLLYLGSAGGTSIARYDLSLIHEK